MIRDDIRLKPDEEREEVYNQINSLALQGKSAVMAEDKSGFPAVTIDAEDIHVLTDILSVQQWWTKLEKKEAK